MATHDVMTFSAPPSYGPMYRKILFGKRRPGLKAGTPLPALAAECASLSIDHDNLSAYREVCGVHHDFVPILYPHVMTGSLHFAIMTHDEFPLSMMGALHLRNHVLQHRPLSPSDTFKVVCSLDAHRRAKAGMELDVSTILTRGEERVWESISTYLVRGKFGEPEEQPARAQIAEAMPEDEAASWHIPPGTGRRYAKVCGDYNPIHLHPLTAKLFGFKRDIVHGMWAAGTAIANLDLPQEDAAFCDLLFKGPTYMNSTVRLLRASVEDGVRFDLYAGSNPKPTINGWWRKAEPHAQLVSA